MHLELDGKRALVTGGSRGIGRAIVESLLAEGAHVATCGRTASSLAELVAANAQSRDLEKSDAKTGILYADSVDVCDGAAVAKWFAASIERLGGLDILISNVSMQNTGEGEERWFEGMRIDILQHVRLVDLATPYLIKSGVGSITFINSLANIQVDLPRAYESYGVFKAGLLNYAAQLSYHLTKKGVRVNSVSPGPIVTPGGAWDAPDTSTAIYKTYLGRSGFKRFGMPAEVAKAAVFLASPAASWISNVNIRVDGGSIKAPNY